MATISLVFSNDFIDVEFPFQIVLKCHNEAVAKRFLLALSSLLPLGCVRMLYAEEYRHVFV